jgi:hypothetical protein
MSQSFAVTGITVCGEGNHLSYSLVRDRPKLPLVPVDLGVKLSKFSPYTPILVLVFPKLCGITSNCDRGHRTSAVKQFNIAT